MGKVFKVHHSPKDINQNLNMTVINFKSMIAAAKAWQKAESKN
jgi:hypothetical protein